MTAYPLAGAREARLVVWLKHNGIELRRRKGVLVALVPRRNKRPRKLTLRDYGTTAAFVGDRKSNRSIRLERLMREWNQAEMYLPGASHDLARHTRERLADQPDHHVQGMVDFYAGRPIGLESIGAEEVRVEFDSKKRRTVERRFVAIRTLCDLVVQLGNRRAHAEELEAREAAFSAAAETAPTKCSLPATLLEPVILPELEPIAELPPRSLVLQPTRPRLFQPSLF